ncbi:hypothetical protein [Paracoccus sulfuroxidans]|uniref:Lipoprotein n=1 Tax=Paracoccus sulfuroxidans TaxID=384678 RepID=A0A562NKQ5_9RHOB|nr:hypothetical protein [Paracoccus sulfuroxidans]TWI32738.1 hypothetical protein IQ24_02613 [Paracoccus sulfuroxidans]
MRRIALSLIVIGLSACSEDGSLGQEGSPVWLSTASQEAKTAYFTKVCSGYGFQPGTPHMAQCIQTETGNIRARGAAAAASYQASQPTYTTCNRFGQMVSCSSY